MRPQESALLFESFEKDYGVVGVAYGFKEVNGKDDDTPCATFFVEEKLPEEGGNSTLSSGQKILPKMVTLHSEKIFTDVVTIKTKNQGLTGSKSSGGIRRSGTRISNGGSTGTIGCLVKDASNTKFVLTNSHIGISTGRKMYTPTPWTVGAHILTTQKTIDFVEDEEFWAFTDTPNTVVDVDACLIKIKKSQEAAFQQDVPYFGAITGAFEPTTSDVKTYLKSLNNLDVFSYSWKSKKRFGKISHIFYTFRNIAGKAVLANLLIRGSKNTVPGLKGDSGKVWLTKINGANYFVGLHFGEVRESSNSPRFAMATEAHSLLNFLNVQLA